jgi:hypothetical protein
MTALRSMRNTRRSDPCEIFSIRELSFAFSLSGIGTLLKGVNQRLSGVGFALPASGNTDSEIAQAVAAGTRAFADVPGHDPQGSIEFVPSRTVDCRPWL